jgi:hypothetical protein
MMPKVDMSDKAVTARLKRVSQLRRLSLSLGTAKIIRESAKSEGSSAVVPPKQDKHKGK